MGLGGQEIGTVREAKYLLKKGHDVVIVCQPRSRIAERCMHENIPFRNVAGMRKAFLAPFTMSKALLLLLRYRPHVVHCHSARDHWIFGPAACSAPGRREDQGYHGKKLYHRFMSGNDLSNDELNELAINYLTRDDHEKFPSELVCDPVTPEAGPLP